MLTTFTLKDYTTQKAAYDKLMEQLPKLGEILLRRPYTTTGLPALTTKQGDAIVRLNFVATTIRQPLHAHTFMTSNGSKGVCIYDFERVCAMVGARDIHKILVLINHTDLALFIRTIDWGAVKTHIGKSRKEVLNMLKCIKINHLRRCTEYLPYMQYKIHFLNKCVLPASFNATLIAWIKKGGADA